MNIKKRNIWFNRLVPVREKERASGTNFPVVFFFSMWSASVKICCGFAAIMLCPILFLLHKK
jgi:hypothetical protein